MQASTPSSRPASRPSASVWLNALVVTSFIGVMVLSIEGILAYVGGSMFHSTALGFGTLVVMVLPTVGWLVFKVLRTAVSAERDLTRASASSGEPDRLG